MISNQFRTATDGNKLFNLQGQYYAMTGIANFLDKIMSEEELDG